MGLQLMSSIRLIRARMLYWGEVKTIPYFLPEFVFSTYTSNLRYAQLLQCLQVWYSAYKEACPCHCERITTR